MVHHAEQIVAVLVLRPTVVAVAAVSLLLLWATYRIAITAAAGVTVAGTVLGG